MLITMIRAAAAAAAAARARRNPIRGYICIYIYKTETKTNPNPKSQLPAICHADWEANNNAAAVFIGRISIGSRISGCPSENEPKTKKPKNETTAKIKTSGDSCRL